MIENFLAQKYFQHYGTNTYNDYTQMSTFKDYLTFTVVMIVKITLLLLAGYLAWECNKNEGFCMQFFSTLIAMLFSSIYLIYYFVYRVLLNNSCNSSE